MEPPTRGVEASFASTQTSNADGYSLRTFNPRRRLPGILFLERTSSVGTITKRV